MTTSTYVRPVVPRDLDVVVPAILEAMRESLFQRNVLPWSVRDDTCMKICPESWATAKDKDAACFALKPVKIMSIKMIHVSQ